MKNLLYILGLVAFASCVPMLLGGSLKWNDVKEVFSVLLNTSSISLAVLSIWLGFCGSDILKNLFGSSSRAEKDKLFKSVKHLLIPSILTLCTVAVSMSVLIIIPIVKNFFVQYSRCYCIGAYSLTALALILWLLVLFALAFPIYSFAAVIFSAIMDLKKLEKKDSAQILVQLSSQDTSKPDK